ncbi:methyltransferase type 12 [Intrasporangium oryzae NRRL B-24470]|uniref:Methyltransferase type 12 n=1 Tax=Intrasporangium oryzae NRRL B-24470 TaxID=1386089 RepID=W9G6H7_9MICO|nr:hypothetical protein [Intrasporangium oryzae]EWT01791.1 methyltransferase type 12 [Intrasporangium oryzae NRRL B-24470]
MTGAPARADDNARTLAAYEQRAQLYREQTRGAGGGAVDALLRTLATQAPEGTVLEIGSAHGRDADVLESLGRQVRRTDATRAFVEMQRADGHVADVLDVLTDRLVDETVGPYAAVLADAVFLHFTPAQLRTVLVKVRDALVAGGLLGFTVKVGEGSEWSTHKLGVPRFFHYWQPAALRAEIEAAGLEVVALEVESGPVVDWIVVICTPVLPPSPPPPPGGDSSASMSG